MYAPAAIVHKGGCILFKAILGETSGFSHSYSPGSAVHGLRYHAVSTGNASTGLVSKETLGTT